MGADDGERNMKSTGRQSEGTRVDNDARSPGRTPSAARSRGSSSARPSLTGGALMHLVSVNVGTPEEIGKFRGQAILSAIVKSPVSGQVIVGRLNLAGDRQADLSVHGGVDKAVYVYPSEHYGYWKERYPEIDMSWGAFGENFTTEGLLEDDVHLGDRFIIGSAEFAATQPRVPCFKLGMRFETMTMIRSFLEAERSGFYLRVLKEGQVEAGDEIRVAKVNSNSDTMASIFRTIARGE